MRITSTIFLITLSCCILSYTGIGQTQPRVEAKVGRTGSGLIKLNEFKAQLGVRSLGWINNIHAEPVTIDSFTLSVLRDTLTIISKKNRGAYFLPELRSLFEKITSGDRVLIYDIYSTVADKKVLVSPVEYLIE